MAKKLFEVLIVVSPVLDCLRFCLLSALQDLFSPAMEDIGGRHVTLGLVVPVEVVVLNDNPDARNNNFDVYIQNLSELLELNGHTVNVLQLRDIDILPLYTDQFKSGNTSLLHQQHSAYIFLRLSLELVMTGR